MIAEDEVINRRTANCKATLVLDPLKGKRTLVDACLEYDVRQSELEERMELFVPGGSNRLKSRPKDEQALAGERKRRFKAQIGELVMEVDILRRALAGPRSDERT